MTSWQEVLNDAWNQLAQTAPISRQYRSRLISTEVPLGILAGMRAIDDAPCLILPITLPSQALFELGGMRLNSVPDDFGPLLVLSLEDNSRRDLFTTICADVVDTAARADKNEALSLFLSRLAAWRQFLRDHREGLSPAETIGLIGELLVLEKLLETDARRLSAWQAPMDGLHDFQISGHAIEVKTGLGPSSAISISKLDQLDTLGLERLDLLHVRLIESPDGHCLGEIIIRLSALIPNDSARRAFENALLRRGLLPGDDRARNAPRIKPRTIDAYSITERFPRLVRSELPIAIAEASYTIDVRAISAFSEDTAAVLEAFNRRDQP